LISHLTGDRVLKLLVEQFRNAPDIKFGGILDSVLEDVESKPRVEKIADTYLDTSAPLASIPLATRQEFIAVIRASLDTLFEK
jgi:hypothetical protein